MASIEAEVDEVLAPTVKIGEASEPVWLWVLKCFIAVLLLGGTLAAALLSLRWPLVHDGPLMHYVVFLLDHGMAPYRQILDINMPGTYFIHWTVIHLLGPGGAAWRAFDLICMGTVLAAALAISWPYEWLAGVVGGAYFCLYHLTSGGFPIEEVGQRDFIIAVLILCGCAFLFGAVRSGNSAWMLGAGFCLSLAGTIKPPAFSLAVLLPLWACIELHRSGRRAVPAAVWAVSGSSIPIAAMAIFLLRENAVEDFWNVLGKHLVLYAKMGNMPLSELVKAISHPREVAILLCAVIFSAAQRRLRASWEFQVLWVGLLFGTGSYFLQHKGWPYHTYPYVIFLGVIFALAVTQALRRPGIIRTVSFAILLLLSVWMPIKCIRAVRGAFYPMDLLAQLGQDMESLHLDGTYGQVQCLDMTTGCLNTLYRDHIVQATGLIYDYEIFDPQPWPAVTETRDRFLAAFEQSHPRVIVLTEGLWPDTFRGYGFLENWPAFTSYLGRHYHLETERSFFSHNKARGYRIYLWSQN